MRILVCPLTAAASLALATPAFAQDPEVSCTIRASGMNFGLYSALDQAPSTTLGRIDVVCLPPAATLGIKVSLSPGLSGQPLDRVMTNGEAELHYNLYADPAHQQVLGDGSNGTVPPVQLTRALGRSNFRVYGSIRARQAVPAGEYSDTVRVEIEF